MRKWGQTFHCTVNIVEIIFTFQFTFHKKGSRCQTHLLSVVWCVGQHCRDMKHQLKVFISGVKRVCACGVRCTEDEIMRRIIPLNQTHTFMTTHKISFLFGLMCTHLQMAHLWRLRDYEKLCDGLYTRTDQLKNDFSRTHFKKWTRSHQAMKEDHSNPWHQVKYSERGTYFCCPAVPWT